MEGYSKHYQQPTCAADVPPDRVVVVTGLRVAGRRFGSVDCTRGRADCQKKHVGTEM